MRNFDILSAIAAPLPLANVDTDKILPARFLKTIRREGLGSALFHTLRFDETGSERRNFILNRPPWRDAKILITGDNFGCGSSREHAPWALKDFGIRCLIAPSFADIFYSNCFKNGILPIALEGGIVEQFLVESAVPETAIFTIDLPTQRICRTDGEPVAFNIAPERKRTLLLGLDDIAETLQQAAHIDAYESLHRDYESENRADACCFEGDNSTS
jgi:3-isopropylmalate/(R)-2-methylmalate dehydratase small subunit